MPQAGLLDQVIRIWRRNVVGQNSFGEDLLGSPTIVLMSWARVEYLAGRELERVMQKWAEAKYKIEMRQYLGTSIQREDWLEWNEQTIDILDVQGQGTREAKWVIIGKDHVA